MGMFDEIICDYPLPGDSPFFIEPGHRFQTKDLDCCLDTYRITADGSFSDPDFTGDIEFYSSNWCAFEGGFIFTRKGEDYESVTFKATIVNGKVVKIERTEYKREIALSRSEMSQNVPSTPEEDAAWKEKYDVPLKGRRMFFQGGGPNPGYYVTIIEATDREVCWKTDAGRLEVQPIYLGRILFHSKEDAEAYTKKQEDDWNQTQERYRKILESKRAK